MAARGARAAAVKAADHRVPWREHGFGLGSLVSRFCAELRELGWMEGRTVAIEYRWAEGRGERYAEIAAEFVRLKVDVIVTAGGAVPALKRETSVIPIVFAIAVDPVGSGLVASLARPGATSPACQCRQLILLASASKSCARYSLAFTSWRSWQTLAIPAHTRSLKL